MPTNQTIEAKVKDRPRGVFTTKVTFRMVLSYIYAWIIGAEVEHKVKEIEVVYALSQDKE